jgi:hypothetical protein
MTQALYAHMNNKTIKKKVAMKNQPPVLSKSYYEQQGGNGKPATRLHHGK